MWTVQFPASWPGLPSPVSFSTLTAIELCPLQWSLSRATYPDIWKRPGYPEKPTIAKLVGQILHGALEKVTLGLVRARTDLFESEDLGRVLRECGGITALLSEQITIVLQSYAHSPRLLSRVSDIEADLRKTLPAMRQRLQLLLARVTSTNGGRSQQSFAAGPGVLYGGKRRLSTGPHAEVPLQSTKQEIQGRADLITISESACEITEFKTGLRKTEHLSQLMFYALLWYRDSVANPGERLATRLLVIYSDGIVEVPPPSRDDLADLEQSIESRLVAIRSLLEARPPEARPSLEACPTCPVRQLCPVYWKWMETEGLVQTSKAMLTDAELRIERKQANWTWQGTVRVSANLPEGSRVLVRGRPTQPQLCDLLDSTRDIRLLNVQVFPTEEGLGDQPVVSLTRSSEVFDMEPAGGGLTIE